MADSKGSSYAHVAQILADYAQGKLTDEQLTNELAEYPYKTPARLKPDSGYEDTHDWEYGGADTWDEVRRAWVTQRVPDAVYYAVIETFEE